MFLLHWRHSYRKSLAIIILAGLYTNRALLMARFVFAQSFILLRIMGRLQRLVHACQSQMVLVGILLRLIEISFR